MSDTSQGPGVVDRLRRALVPARTPSERPRRALPPPRCRRSTSRRSPWRRPTCPSGPPPAIRPTPCPAGRRAPRPGPAMPDPGGFGGAGDYFPPAAYGGFPTGGLPPARPQSMPMVPATSAGRFSRGLRLVGVGFRHGPDEPGLMLVPVVAFFVQLVIFGVAAAALYPALHAASTATSAARPMAAPRAGPPVSGPVGPGGGGRGAGHVRVGGLPRHHHRQGHGPLPRPGRLQHPGGPGRPDQEPPAAGLGLHQLRGDVASSAASPTGASWAPWSAGCCGPAGCWPVSSWCRSSSSRTRARCPPSNARWSCAGAAGGRTSWATGPSASSGSPPSWSTSRWRSCWAGLRTRSAWRSG